MKITWNWLGEFVELEQTPAAVADRLAMAGLEVESIEERGRELRPVRVAEIVALRPHPQAERLTVCDVRLGPEAPLTVVCGAPNVRAGLRVAYAPPSTVLPAGKQVSNAEIRGVASAGMLCSEAELGIGPDESGLLILPGDAPLGDSLAALLGIDDVVLDVSITPNRGDCLSVIGMAREIAALTGQKLKRPRVNVSESGQATADLISIRISADDLCGRYVARIIDKLSIAPSPLWLQYRLRAVGMRPINNVVDVTNYVLLERGQPLHAFDYDRLPRKEIVVRRAGASSTFVTLDGQTRQLASEDLLISSGDEPVALAGVMGGANSEVSNDTKRILLESAWFLPSSIRRTARRLGVKTEASFRFERCVDIEAVGAAADRAAAMMARLGAGVVLKGVVDVYPGARSPAPISVRLKRMDDLLGMSVPRNDVIGKLKALGMSVSPATRGAISVVPPSYCAHLEREIDIVEEVVRSIGYEHVPATLPHAALTGPGIPPQERCYRELRRSLTAQGFNEALPPSFTSASLNELLPGLRAPHKPVAVLNPMSNDDAQLRLSLTSSLARVLRHNLAQANEAVALFVLGKVFWQAEDFHEAVHLGGVVCPGFPTRGVATRATRGEFADIKGVVESLLDVLRIADAQWRTASEVSSFHPGKTARITIGDACIGMVGSLHPSAVERLELADPCWVFELDLTHSLQYSPPRAVFQELPRFPAVRRDLAIIADARFAADEVVRFVRRWVAGAALIEEVSVFDEYSGPPIPTGKKSLAYSIAYRALDRTLTDQEVNELHTSLLVSLTEELGVQPR